MESSRLYTLNYTFKSSRKTLGTSIEYATQAELESELGASIVSLKPSWRALLKHPRQSLKSWIYGIELNIEMESEEPEFLRKSLLHIAKRYSNISAINIENKTAEDPLIQALKSRIDTRDKEIVRRRNKIQRAILFTGLWTLVGKSLSTVVFATSFAPLSVALLILKDAVITAIWTKCRQWYLDSSAVHYSKKNQINVIMNHRELTALDWGACSVGTRKYLLSYFSPSAWRHPRAFAAGLELSLEGKQKRVDLIHERYLALKP